MGSPVWKVEGTDRKGVDRTIRLAADSPETALRLGHVRGLVAVWRVSPVRGARVPWTRFVESVRAVGELAWLVAVVGILVKINPDSFPRQRPSQSPERDGRSGTRQPR